MNFDLPDTDSLAALLLAVEYAIRDGIEPRLIAANEAYGFRMQRPDDDRGYKGLTLAKETDFCPPSVAIYAEGSTLENWCGTRAVYDVHTIVVELGMIMENVDTCQDTRRFGLGFNLYQQAIRRAILADMIDKPADESYLRCVGAKELVRSNIHFDPLELGFTEDTSPWVRVSRARLVFRQKTLAT